MSEKLKKAEHQVAEKKQDFNLSDAELLGELDEVIEKQK